MTPYSSFKEKIMNIRTMSINRRKLMWLIAVVLVVVVGLAFGYWDFSQMPPIGWIAVAAMIIGGMTYKKN